MEDYLSSDDEYYYSDRDSLDGFENEDTDPQWVTSKGPSSKVIFSVPLSYVVFLLSYWQSIRKKVVFVWIVLIM